MIRKTYTALALFIYRWIRFQERLLRTSCFPLACRLYTLDQKENFNQRLYDRDRSYTPEGKTFRSGLFPWEESFLKKYELSEGKKILLPACGGGREIAEFLKRDLSVLGFDISGELLKEARKTFQGNSRVTLEQLSLRELKNENSFLWKLGPFDALCFGWGSISYFSSLEDIESSMKLFKKKNPHSPILLSFLATEEFPEGRAEKWGRFSEKWISKILRLRQRNSGEYFAPELGFHLRLSPQDVRQLAGNAGYKVAQGDLAPFPHAYLLPTFSVNSQAKP